MSYRRDIQSDEPIPLPLETIYNSTVDAIRDSSHDLNRYYHQSDKYFNRLYFKYPPEWKTSNIGEKIIGIRNMTTKWRDGDLDFVLYIRKYDRNKFDDVVSELNDRLQKLNIDIEDHVITDQEIIDNMKLYDIMVYKIPIHIHVSSTDNWINIKDQIRQAIDNNNLYNYLKQRINKREIANDQRLELLNQLESIKNDYKTMLLKSNELIGDRLRFYLRSSDIDIIDTSQNGEHSFILQSSVDLAWEDDLFTVDFMITNTDPVAFTYEKFYSSRNGEPLPYSHKQKDNQIDKIVERIRKQETGEEEEDGEEEDIYIPDPELDDRDKFDPYTANFFNLGNNNPHRNSLEYVTQFHETFELKNLMTDLDCEVAASFANQSNHNLIGRTNEKFIPIKYYKLNDNDDTFWIEFYDKNEIKIPLAINNNVVFTIDMVFLQNRKLLYS